MLLRITFQAQALKKRARFMSAVVGELEGISCGGIGMIHRRYRRSFSAAN